MLLFACLASSNSSWSPIAVIFQKFHLNVVPGHLVYHHIPSLQFIVKRVSNWLKIVATQIIQVGIAQHFFKLILRYLGYPSRHDHTTDNVNLIWLIAKAGQHIADILTSPFFMPTIRGNE